MADIYSSIGDEFDRINILENLANISNELKDEQSKPVEEQNKEKQLKLINRQFMEGLKLSTGFYRFW